MNAHTDTIRRKATLAEVYTAVERTDGFAGTRRRDLLSDLATVARWLDLPMVSVSANTAELRERLSKLHHVQLGISEKRLRNAISNVAFAIRSTNETHCGQRNANHRTPEWIALLNACHQDWERYRLASLANYCSSEDIAPEAVDDAVLREFRSHLEDTKLRKDPDATCRQAIQTWNKMAKTLESPKIRWLTPPRSDKHWTIPLSEFPKAFQDDLAAWIQRLSDVDVFEEDGPVRALRPQTIENVKTNVRHAANALLEKGTPIESITSLSILTKVENFKAILRFFIDRNDGNVPTWLYLLASKLRAIAHYHVRLNQQELDTISTLTNRVKVSQGTITEKNRTRLGQFEDPRNVLLLVGLSSHVTRRVKGVQSPSRWDALSIMYAVGVDILLAVPMRRSNLAAIDVERHLTWRGQGAGRYAAVAIPGQEVKNGVAIEADLPKETSRLLRLYIDRYRPFISQDPGSWLFPMESRACHRTPASLANQIFNFIRRETGLEVNAHLFRHLSGMLYLMEFPGQYEVVRRMLGHKSVETTTRFYSDMESKWALKRYDEEVLAARRGDHVVD